MPVRRQLAELLLDIKYRGRPDALRKRRPFSIDMQAAHALLLSPGLSRADKIVQYRRWLSANQPCVFGRRAANNKNVFVCLLEEAEIVRMRVGDDDVRETIQEHRQAWKRYALEGLTSSFVILIVSAALVEKAPGDQLKEICRRVLELYMDLESIPDDTIQSEREYVFLRGGTGRQSEYVRFGTLPNIFAAQGDGRWWHDHRTPAGIMVTSNALGHLINVTARGTAGGVGVADYAAALENAMRTIGNAYRPTTAVGRRALPHCPATKLVADEGAGSPLKQSSPVAQYSAQRYEGFFNTDYLIPSVFFQDARDPANIPSYPDLSFGYIWDATSDPVDHKELVVGIPARPYEVRANMARLPSFGSPESTEPFDNKARRGLRNWLAKQLRERLF